MAHGFDDPDEDDAGYASPDNRLSDMEKAMLSFQISPKSIKPVFDMERGCVSEFEILKKFTDEEVVDTISRAYRMGIVDGSCDKHSYRILAGDLPGDKSGDVLEDYFEEVSESIEVDFPGLGRIPGEVVETRKKYNHLPEFFLDKSVSKEDIREFVRGTLAEAKDGIADFRFPDAWIGLYRDRDGWVFDNLQPSYFLWAYAHFL